MSLLEDPGLVKGEELFASQKYAHTQSYTETHTHTLVHAHTQVPGLKLRPQDFSTARVINDLCLRF